MTPEFDQPIRHGTGQGLQHLLVVLRLRDMLRSIWMSGIVRLLALCPLVAATAWSQEPELFIPNYSVRNVVSTASAETASAATAIAEQRAIVAAFRELVTRIVPQDHQHEVLVPTDTQLASLLLRSTTTYARQGLRSSEMTLAIEFNGAEVHDYLNSLQVPYSTAEQQRLSLLPMAPPVDDDLRAVFGTADGEQYLKRLVAVPAVEWIVSRPLEVATLTTLRGDIDAVQALEIAFSQGALGGYVLGFDILPNSVDGNETIRFQADRFGDAIGPEQFVYESSQATDASSAVKVDQSPNSQKSWMFAAYEQMITALNDEISNEWTLLTAELHGPTNAIGIVVLGMTSDEWFGLAPELEDDPLVSGSEFVQTRQGILDVTVQFYGGLRDLQHVFLSRGFQFDAYSLVDQPNVVGFLLRPEAMEMPQGVSLLDLDTIRLSY